jgi:hypothetical protein
MPTLLRSCCDLSSFLVLHLLQISLSHCFAFYSSFEEIESAKRIALSAPTLYTPPTQIWLTRFARARFISIHAHVTHTTLQTRTRYPMWVCIAVCRNESLNSKLRSCAKHFLGCFDICSELKESKQPRKCLEFRVVMFTFPNTRAVRI